MTRIWNIRRPTYEKYFIINENVTRRDNLVRQSWLSHCLDIAHDLNNTKLKPPVRLMLFLRVFFLVTTLRRGVDCCSRWGAGGGSRHAIGWPGPASPADTANIFRLYVTAAAARAFLYVQDATSAAGDVTTVVSPCQNLPERDHVFSFSSLTSADVWFLPYNPYLACLFTFISRIAIVTCCESF